MKNLSITRSCEAGGNLREFMERTRLARPEQRFEERATIEVSATVSPRTMLLLAASLAAIYAPALAPMVARVGDGSGEPRTGEERS